MREMVDRDRERQQLLDAARTAPSLIIVIGRRRVGKSFLLERAFAGERVISFQGDEQDENHQLELFAAEAGRVLLGSDALRFSTLDAALSFLGEQARTAPMTIILDEFQWLKYAQPALDSIIQRHWDRWGPRGSASDPGPGRKRADTYGGVAGTRARRCSDGRRRGRTAARRVPATPP